MKKEKSKNAAKAITRILDKVLVMEANSTSCVIVYEPKVPKSISKFKKEK